MAELESLSSLSPPRKAATALDCRAEAHEEQGEVEHEHSQTITSPKWACRNWPEHAAKIYVAVTLPAGARPGMNLQATSHEDITFAFQVPENVKEGDVIQVEVPRDSASNDSFSNDSFSATPNIFQVDVAEGLEEGEEVVATAPNGVRFKCQIPVGSRSAGSFYVSLPEETQKWSGGPLSVYIPPEASAGQRMQAVAPDGTPFAFMVHTHTHNTHTHTHHTHAPLMHARTHTHTHTTRQSTDESSCPVLILVLPSSYQLNLMLNKPLVPTKPRSCSSLFSSFIHNPGS